MGEREHAPRWPGRVALGACLLSTSLALAGVLLHFSAAAAGRPVTTLWASDVIVAVLFPAVGALVLRRDPRNACGWVLTSCALVGVSLLAHHWAYDAEVTRPGVLPFGELAVWLSAWTYWPYWLQPSLLPVLFPAGHPTTRRWQQFTRAVLAVAALGVLVSAFKPDEDVEGMGLSNPLGVGSAELALPWMLAQIGCVVALGLVAAPVALVGLARRQRRAVGAERAQLQWLLLGFASCLLLGIGSAVSGGVLEDLLFGLGFAAIPVCIAVAILRHGMLDVEVVVNRTIVYAVLTGAGLLAYLGLVAVAGRYVGTDGAGPYVAAPVVALAASGRMSVQRLVDRRLFGARRDPYAVVLQVSASTAAATDNGVSALVTAVRQSLRLPFVQVLDAGGDVVAESGAPVAGTHVLPVVARGRQLGVLVVGRRSHRERLRPEEESALREVARRAGELLHAGELTADLRRSDERTGQAREQERRRLRQDLHDGVGPSLAGMALQLDSLAGRLGDDPELAARAEGLRDRLRGTVTEVRRIVDGLRPATVDDLGLGPALRLLSTAEPGSVQVDVHVDLPDELPAAVEVAAYRIASEAVANVLRHAQADRAVLVAEVTDGRLRLAVEDDGCGFGAEARTGVGIESIRARAAEIGGRLEIRSTGAGTRVEAVLPL